VLKITLKELRLHYICPVEILISTEFLASSHTLQTVIISDKLAPSPATSEIKGTPLSLKASTRFDWVSNNLELVDSSDIAYMTGCEWHTASPILP
jgi:hypothetical protein